MNTPSQLVASALKRVTETEVKPGHRDDGGSLGPIEPAPGEDSPHVSVRRPPEGGPMPDAKLDSAEAAWGFYQALEHNNEEEQQAWVNAIKAGGLDTVGLIELGLHFRAFRNGGRAAGKLIDMLKGTTPETET
jgi:hypothetical protein